MVGGFCFAFCFCGDFDFVAVCMIVILLVLVCWFGGLVRQGFGVVACNGWWRIC